MKFLVLYEDYEQRKAEIENEWEKADPEYSDDGSREDYQRKLAKRRKLRNDKLENQEAMQKLVRKRRIGYYGYSKKYAKRVPFCH